jgi:aerobic-type carbon monoxide dehydrogenase small subunit (CoxS/CutS family)
MQETIQFILNGRPTTVTTDSSRMLLWLLRTDLGLTGSKYGCGEAICGACTVLVDGEAVRSCSFPVKDVSGTEVMTIEGLARNGKLHPLQEAFMAHDALQCGFCTPGMIMSAYSFILKKPSSSYEDIIEYMDDHLCRCGCYNRIVQAIQSASRTMKGAAR